VHGNAQLAAKQADAPAKVEQSWAVQAAVLCFLVLGLQGSYIAWGVLQEEMMTQPYGSDLNGEPVFFKNSQYLVFLNRALAFVIASLIVNFTQQPANTVALYKYSFPSLSNILSSWCQYEALKYVSFPTQVLAKASKTIPVMLMGKVIEGKTYPIYEYGCSVIMSLGVCLFFFSGGDSSDAGPMKTTTITGAMMLLGYMVFDRWVGASIFSVLCCVSTFLQR
jgi:adenosine 3'-phospho 5'-phosphosulfate transporter B2